MYPLLRLPTTASRQERNDFYVVQFIHDGTQQPGYKIMVFCTTARVAGFLADFFTAAGMRGVSQIHSRMSQPARTKASNAFRNSDGGVIMFTSDVSARGVDYPGTSLVLQVRPPAAGVTHA
jgi:ATP-dependent RNA helicase MSS116, mitochondrial